jgi:hypothetical protein
LFIRSFAIRLYKLDRVEVDQRAGAQQVLLNAVLQLYLSLVDEIIEKLQYTYCRCGQGQHWVGDIVEVFTIFQYLSYGLVFFIKELLDKRFHSLVREVSLLAL